MSDRLSHTVPALHNSIVLCINSTRAAKDPRQDRKTPQSAKAEIKNFDKLLAEITVISVISMNLLKVSTGRMKVNLRRLEDMKIRLKKSSKTKHLREGISRTDLQFFIS